MPLFRSNSSSEVTPRRSDLERQIGCIAGFFQIFDQQQRKQIAGPQKEATPAQRQPPPLPESSTSSDTVPKDDDATQLGHQCTADAKVKDLTVAGGDGRTSIDTCVDTHGRTATQLVYLGNFDESSLTNPSQEEKLHRGKTSNVREELPAVSMMVRHGSFNHSREYREDDILFSPRRGHIGAYAAGGRRFTSKEMNTQGRFSVDTIEESRGLPREEERWGFWSSPASHWPSNGIAGQQGLTHETAVEESKGGWPAKGGRAAAERQWAAEDSLEDWKQSLRALARLREDGETGVSSSRGGCVAPKASPRSVRNDPSASPARASAFDFKEAVRWSQRVSSQTECSRRSWDDRDLPRSIAELRDALHARSHILSAASPPPSPRPPSVVARLMGLDDLPKPPPPEPAPFTNHRHRKPSGEAKLLQQLLQYSPPNPPPFTHSPLPPSPTLNSLRRGGHGVCVAENPTSTPHHRDPPTRSELQSLLKNLEMMTHTGSTNTSSTKFINNISNHAKLQESTGHAGTTWEGATEHCPVQPSALKKNNQQSLPVVVLKQSEDMRSPSPRANHGFHDEIERRLRMLGLQSSEQERKTLKQILEAMQIKGLLRPPDSTKSSNETKRLQVSSPGSPRFVGSASPTCAPADSWPPPTSKSMTRPNSNAIRAAKNDSAASIVIMRPVAKSVSRVPPPSVNERRVGAVAPSKTEKITTRKPKNAGNPETNTLKESGSSRSKSRSTPALQHTPVPTRKLSLRIRQGQVHLVKGTSRATPSEQARKSGSDIPSARRQEQAAPCKGLKKSTITNACEIPSNAPENRTSVEADYAHNSDTHVTDKIPDVVKQPSCILGASGASLGAEVLEVTSMKEAGVGTPPRQLKGERSFGESGDCFSKEVVHEQCSPVSVLDAHLSDNEVEESPAVESIRVLTHFQEDISSSMEEFRFPLQASICTETTQPIPVEMYLKATMMDSIKEASPRDEDLLEANEAAEGKRGQACASPVDSLYSENVLQDDMACTSASACYPKDVVGPVGDCIDKSGECKQMKETYGNNDMDATFGSNGASMCMDNDANALTGDRMYNACQGKGDYTGELCTNNADYCYTEDVLRAVGLTGAWAGGGCAADGWLACGGEMRREVFEELEQQWDAVNAEEEEEYIDAEDRDMGGELYRKGQQASMRRRLVFDCLNEIIEGRLSWLGMPGACSVGAYPRHLPVSMVWGDLQRLEQGPCSAEDSMYAMLEQDLLHDADYSKPLCWSGMPTQLAVVALHLENDILDALVSEVLPQASL